MSEYVEIVPGQLPEDKLTVIGFSKPGCAPCNILKPQLKKVAESSEYIGKVDFYSVNPQITPEWIMELGMTGVPLTVGFKGNEVVFKVSGANIDDIKKGIEGNM